MINALVLIILILAGVELAARTIYYSRKTEFGLSQKIILVFFGRWLINEYGTSSVYLKEIAASLDVDNDFMISVLSESSGMDPSEIRRLFLGKDGEREHTYLSPMTGFIPAPHLEMIHTQTNSDGFRGIDRPRAKGKDVKRVLLFGGSVTFGRTATSNSATIAGQLEEMLNQHALPGENIRWEVLNFGVPDFISYQELVLLIKKGMQYEPDIVISFTGFNDAHHYLATGSVNAPASMNRVKAAYNAFFGGSIHRIISFLSTFLISVECLRILIQRTSGTEEEELSPFIYTIW